MTFEGKLLNEKPVETAKAAVPSEKVKPPPAATAAPKKKTHRFRNFILTTLILGSVGYIGGAYYALQDDDFHDYFVDYIPFGDDLIAFIEDRRFRQRFSSISAVAKSNNGAKTPGGLESVRIPKSGATWKAVDEPVDKPGAVNIMKPGPHLSASPVKPEEPAAKASSILPLIPVPSNADDIVKNSINAMNEFIGSVNSSKYSEEHIEKISKEITGLAQSISEIKNSFKEELSKKVHEEAAKVGSVVNDKTTELRSAVAAQEEKWIREFQEEQKRLAASYNERLKNEIEAANKVIFTHANNQLLAVHAEREKQFAAEILERVENERDGRLANLEELAKSLADIEELTVKADRAILEADNVAQLHIAIGRLKTILESEKPVALGPYIEAVRELSGSDPLLKATLDSIPKDVYEQGVLTPAQLAARFHLLEPEIRKASLLPPNAGVAGHIGSMIFSKLLWSKSGNSTGDDVESILSRADTALSEGRVVDAVGEVNTLKGWPKRLAHDWLIEGRKRSEMEFLTEVLAEEGKLWGLEI